MVSPAFLLGNQHWNLWLFPNGSNNKEYLALYLDMPGAAQMPDVWSLKVHLTLAVRNQKTQAETVTMSRLSVSQKRLCGRGFVSL